MFTFSDTVREPVVVDFNGKEYSVPLFLRPDFEAWAAATRRKQLDEALSLAGVKEPEDRMRLAAYFSPPPIDLLTQVDMIPTAEGSAYIVKVCTVKAGIDPALVDRLTAAHPILVRELACRLADRAGLQAEINAIYGEPVKTKENSDPLAGASDTSGGSPSTGGSSTPT